MVATVPVIVIVIVTILVAVILIAFGPQCPLPAKLFRWSY